MQDRTRAHFVSILTQTVFERSASVDDIIRVSAGVTVTVESKQQTWTKQSRLQRFLCVGCPLKRDQAIRSLCLKGHVRARGSTLWWHCWQEASEFFCTKTPLFGESWTIKNIAKNPRKCSLRRATNVMFSNAKQIQRRSGLQARFLGHGPPWTAGGISAWHRHSTSRRSLLLVRLRRGRRCFPA